VGVYRPVDPGKHDVVATPVGGTAVKASVTLGNGEKKDIKLTIGDATPIAEVGPTPGPSSAGPDQTQPAPASRGFFTPMRIAGIASATLGVGGAVLGGVMMAGRSSAQSDADTQFAACNKPPTGCTSSQKASISSADQDAATKGTISVVGFAAGGALLVTGVTLIVIGGPKAQSTGNTRVTPWFTGRAAGLEGTF
jgi:hypothetical protein